MPFGRFCGRAVVGLSVDRLAGGRLFVRLPIGNLHVGRFGCRVVVGLSVDRLAGGRLFVRWSICNLFVWPIVSVFFWLWSLPLAVVWLIGL